MRGPRRGGELARGTARAALLVGAAAALLLASGACSDSCPSDCMPPVFDLAMARMDDLSSPQDLATNAAAIVMVGAGGGNTFTPPTVTIQAGQSVTWRWITGSHSIVSDSTPLPFADSPVQSSGQLYAFGEQRRDDDDRGGYCYAA